MQRVLSIILLLFCATVACRDNYGLPVEKSLYNSLVVEGNILIGDSTIFRLSRASAVAEFNLVPEKGAVVTVEGDDNNYYPLAEEEPGIYKMAPFDLHASTKYRLRISSGGKEYESDWTSLVSTAEIDTILWERNKGIEIFVQSKGTSDDSKYYKWDYDEVWQYYGLNQSFLYFTYGVDELGRPTPECKDVEYRGATYNTCVEIYGLEGTVYNDSMYRCWMYVNSTSINIGSTATASENIIRAPVRKIEDNGIELSNHYRIKVSQTGLTKEAYEFYTLLKANSEGMGSIFDAQPSQLKTNLRCVSDPGETVIGFINTTSVKSKQIDISRMGLDGWFYVADTTMCRDSVFQNEPWDVTEVLLLKQLPTKPLGWRNTFPPKRFPTDYITVSRECVDCRLRGGIHKRPDSWPPE